MDRISLFEELRLIERDESEVNGAWKGAHLLLFFMAFVFGSFCTFCFHMLMYLFDEKCVLFPKLQSLTSVKHNVIYEFIPVDKESSDQLPVDFLSSQWVEKSACYLPTYVPLLSGIFGLVWTTMFLMCSTGPRTHTGLQRPWRVLPPVFVFSLVMGILCIYSSSVTHYGLNELCTKLGEITGSSTCSYTVNVATLAYERRIRGVYQAIRLTIISAWLHTLCWLLSAVLALVRVALAVDFQLVRVNVSLVGDVDKMLEHHETQIRTVLPDMWVNDEVDSDDSMAFPAHLVHFTDANTEATVDDIEELYSYNRGPLYTSQATEHTSEHSLVPSESHKLALLQAQQKVLKEFKFLVKILYDILLNVYIITQESESESSLAEDSESSISDEAIEITRQYGKDKINKELSASIKSFESDEDEAKLTSQFIKTFLEEKLFGLLFTYSKNPAKAASSTFQLDKEMQNILDVKLEEKSVRKSSMKTVSVQTDKKGTKSRSQKVQITEPENLEDSTETTQDADKETQTSTKKEKQD